MAKTLEEALAALEAAQDSITKLEGMNATLKKENKDFSSKYAAAKTEAETAKEEAASSNSDELTKANRTIQKLQTDLNAALSRADNTDKAYRNYRATAAINEAIATNNVDSDHASVLARAFKHDIEFTDEGEPLIEGKAVADYFKGYFAKEGLRYVRADKNGGGASQGYDGGKAATWSKLPSTNEEWAEFDKMPVAERNAVCDQLNAPNLKL